MENVPNSLGLFSGDDITRPIQMFLQIIELKSEKEAWTESDKVEKFLGLIPNQIAAKKDKN